MRGPRRNVIFGLVLLMCTLTEHSGESAPLTGLTTRASAAGGSAQRDLRRMTEIVRHMNSRGRHGMKTEAPSTSRAESSSVEQSDVRHKPEKGNHTPGLCPKHKGKIIIHLTGPLYFSPKCRKDVYRLYHHTRDCTIPAYFKRCARLLTRLAGSPMCTEG